MELYFCDLCQAAIPHDDITSRRADVNGKRAVCVACNKTMGGSALTESDKRSAVVEEVTHAGRSGKRQAQVSPSVAAALGVASICLTLFAVIALLVRLESLARHWAVESEATSGKLQALEQREYGTRGFMIAEAGRVTEEVLSTELGRIERMERQLGELRESLLGGEARSGVETDESRSTIAASLLTTGDGLARVVELEQQILFLQSRLFEMGQAESITPAARGQASDRPLPLPQTLGELVARLQDTDSVERVGALYALAKVSDQGVVAHILPLLEDRDRYIRALAARSLERLNARSSVQSLLVTLDDLDPEVRTAAVSALRAICEQQFLYDPRGPSDERRAAALRWREWWKTNWKTFLYGEE